MQMPVTRFRLAVVLAAAFLSLATDWPDEIGGRVVHVADGDTLTVLVEQTEYKIRLLGIDCPEQKQPFGQKAKQFTIELAAGKTVTVNISDRDRYERLVGEVILPDGRILNHELVSAGLAWWYRQYAPNDELLRANEAEAREARKGLWSEPNPVPPWDWRRGVRPENLKSVEPSTCCRICRKGKPCGNSCISRNRQCDKPIGCACAGGEGSDR